MKTAKMIKMYQKNPGVNFVFTNNEEIGEVSDGVIIKSNCVTMIDGKLCWTDCDGESVGDFQINTETLGMKWELIHPTYYYSVNENKFITNNIRNN